MKIKILFICLGNICRSPIAEYLLKHKLKQLGLADQVDVASKATAKYHIGTPMHPGSSAILAKYGIASDDFKCGLVSKTSDQVFDYILTMDQNNLDDLQSLFGDKPQQIFKITDLVPDLGYSSIPDPWYDDNFQLTYDLLDRCTDAVIDLIKLKLNNEKTF